MIKVLIVEDSPTVSQYLEYILGADPEIQIIGNLSNGKQAVEFVKKNRPDIITMDVDMPVMNGFEATRKIMTSIPIPIIIVTASRNAHKLNISLEALAVGALTVIQKPSAYNKTDDADKKNLIKMVKALSKVKVIKRRTSYLKPESKLKKSKTVQVSLKIPSLNELQNRKIIIIGISSGGPEILRKVFKNITPRFPYPILVVQHITEGFLDGMVQWLNNLVQVPIQIAKDNAPLLPGNIYFAPDNYQMGVEANRIKLKDSCVEQKICPSVDFMFNNCADNYGKDVIAMLLTGMGKDGADKLKKLKDMGALTIAQDEQSSLVHGMPGEAIKLNGADYILNPNQIIELLQLIENNTAQN